jgi:hypothetical protein
MTYNWREINRMLPDLDESAVWRLLEYERSGAQRVTVLIRLHQRYTMLRAARERTEILGDIEFPKVMALT